MKIHGLLGSLPNQINDYGIDQRSKLNLDHVPGEHTRGLTAKVKYVLQMFFTIEELVQVGVKDCNFEREKDLTGENG